MERDEFLSLELSNPGYIYIDRVGLFEQSTAGLGAIHCVIVDDGAISRPVNLD